MSYIINGQRFSYDYEELIGELKADIAAGVIETSTLINIVRAKESISEEVNYNPIVDFYYNDDLYNISIPLDSIYDRDEYTSLEWQKMEKERKEMIEQYKKDEPYFEKHTVMAVLTEMEQWNSVI